MNAWLKFSCPKELIDHAGGNRRTDFQRVRTPYVNLEGVGVRGNGHQFMSEKNCAEISKFLMDWLEKNVP